VAHQPSSALEPCPPVTGLCHKRRSSIADATANL
jgi:hypothetical protein